MTKKERARFNELNRKLWGGCGLTKEEERERNRILLKVEYEEVRRDIQSWPKRLIKKLELELALIKMANGWDEDV